MNLSRAAAYALPNPFKARSYAKLWLLTPVPIFGQLWMLGYANLALRRLLKGFGDRELPEANADWRLMVRGVYSSLLTLICVVVAGLICLPFAMSDTNPGSELAPALVQAVAGPTELLISALAAIVSSVVLTRYALTNSVLAALNPWEAWLHLRAEPAIWTTAAVVGYLAFNLPEAIAWVLPLHGDAELLATIVIAPYFWALGLMINTHLYAQAYGWSRRTAAKRAARMGYRW